MIDKDIQAYLGKASPELKEALVEIAKALELSEAIVRSREDPQLHVAARAVLALADKEACAEMYLESLTNGIPKRRGRPRGSKTRKKAEPRRQPDAVVAGPGAAD